MSSIRSRPDWSAMTMASVPRRAAAGEKTRRTRNIAILGGVILLGTLVPALVPGLDGKLGAEFVNFTVLRNGAVPLSIRLLTFYPLLGGLAAVLLALLARHPARGLGLVAAGLLPLVLLPLSAGFRTAFSAWIGEGRVALGLLFVAMSLAILAIYVGARSRWYRPDNSAAVASSVSTERAVMYTRAAPAPRNPLAM